MRSRGCGRMLGLKILRRSLFKKLLFAIDQLIDVIWRELKVVAMRNCIRRTRLHAIAAKDAARVVDIVDACVPLAGRYAICGSVFGGLDVNAIRGTRSGAEKTADTFFEAVLVAMQNVNPAITRLKLNRSVGINLGRGFPKHRLQSDAEALHEGRKCCADFSDDRCHMIEFSRDGKAQQPCAVEANAVPAT